MIRHPRDPAAQHDAAATLGRMEADGQAAETRAHHARIMIEGGCSIEDVAVTFGFRLSAAINAISPALKVNRREQQRVQRILCRLQLAMAD